MFTGTVGYHYFGGERYSWMDCFYMTFITIATIGYGEVVDLSQSHYGRLFTVFIGFAGIATLSYLLSSVTAFILEGDINLAWRRTKMQQKIAKLQGHYIICGVGRVGSNVAHELITTGRTCVLVDADINHIEYCIKNHPDVFYVHGDATDNDILIAAGVLRARGVFAVAHDDSQNLVISLSSKQLNPNLRVVARCHDVKNIEKTRLAGADEIVSPDFTGGLRLVSAMVRPQVVSFLDDMLKSDDNLRMEEIIIPEGFNNKPMDAMNFHSRDFVILAIRRPKGKWLFNPQGQHTIHQGDAMMVMTTPEGRTRLEQLILGVD
jgi:voltage-gated potassium channel